ncbi:MAG TPA: UvrD-helicase domain-containing protein [Tepidisphaeraceae bacterium]
MLSSEELLDGLTEPQRQAASHVDGPLLIIAGAGSGKTRVLTRRVAYLMAQGIPANSILAITFTNKAAGEMKERVGKLLDRNLRDIGRLDQWNPMICTFHSLCMRVLRHYGQRIGVPANFTVYDSSDQTKLVKDALKTLDISTTNFPAGQVHSAISNLKNQLTTAEQFAQSANAFYEKTIARVYGKYQALLTANNALDFDDLLMRVVHGMRDHPDVLAELQERFQYILIDEYQDTNKAQYFLAHTLAAKHNNLCVVGDPDQSIYAWRGADIQNILDFEKDYPKATVVRLEQNYRSTKTILRLASELISKNRRRKEKGLWTENAEGEKARYYVCQTEDDEANTIIDELREQHEKHGRPWSDMAVFYRMNSLSRVIEERLMRQRIPYQVARGVEFYNRKEIKDVLCYLRALCNVSDEVSLERVINTPTRGIGDESVRKMQVHGVASGQNLWAAIQDCSAVPGLSTRAIKSTQSFVATMNALREQVTAPPRSPGAEVQQPENPSVVDLFVEPKAGSVQAIMQAVIEKTGLRASLEKSTDPDKPELANVRELINSGADFDREHPGGTLEEYLAQVSLMSDVDKVRDGGGAITLMTLHAAKGLEFPVVAMIGMEEGVLPHARARTDPSQLEEERRLCFVGITRAQERILFSRAFARTLMGRRERTVPSPFLKEMPADSIEIIDRTDLGFESDEDDAPGGSQFRRGQTVKHPAFGLGKIAEIQEMGRHTRAIVEFARAGRKTLILEYAQLEAV